MGALQELNSLRKRAKELGIEKPHTMKKDELETRIREAEDVGLDPLDVDDEITDADTESVIERTKYAEPLPRPAHGIVRPYAPKRPIVPNRVQVVHHTPTPVKPGRRAR